MNPGALNGGIHSIAVCWWGAFLLDDQNKDEEILFLMFTLCMFPLPSSIQKMKKQITHNSDH